MFEFVQGQPLSALVHGRALHVRRALEFGINLADALADAHAVDLVHGDIRPDTIMITPKDRAKFMNFGLSRFTLGGGSRVNAASPYVSPEGVAGHPADSRSDIYSLGAVMFEMLTGRRRARGLVLSGLNPTVPGELEQLIGRMLAATVEHRAQTRPRCRRAAQHRRDPRHADRNGRGISGLSQSAGSSRGTRALLYLVGLIVLVAVLVAWLTLRRA